MSMYKEKSRLRKHRLLMAGLMLLLSTLACVDEYTEQLADEIESSCRSQGMKYEDGRCVPIAPEEDEAGIVTDDQGEAVSGDIYVGGIMPPAVLSDDPTLNLSENVIIITVDEDGNASGKQKLVFNYTRSGVDDAPVYVYEDYSTIFEGVLMDGHGQLTGTITHHFVSSGPGASDPQDRILTFEATYDVVVSGDGMNAQIISEEIGSENDLFSFEARKQ